MTPEDYGQATAGLPEGSFTIRWDGYHGYRVSIPGLERATVVPVEAYREAVEALRKYGGCLEDCNALSGAPECSCGFDEAMLRARDRAGDGGR